MKPRKRTDEIDAMIEAEADRRARKVRPRERLSSREISELTGLTELYVAQLISQHRRRIESSTVVDVPQEHQA